MIPSQPDLARKWDEAIACLRAGRFEAAETLLRGLCEAEPAQVRVRQVLAQTLLSQGHAEEAVAQARAALAVDPDNGGSLRLLATALSAFGEQEESATIHARALTLEPSDARLWLSYGHTLRMLGQAQHSIEAYRKAKDLAPDLGEAYWSLADLKTYRFSESEIAAMRARLESRELAPMSRAHLLYALGKALEDGGEVARAFACYSEGAAFCIGVGDAALRVNTFVSQSVEIFTKDFFAERRAAGAAEADPIFVLGMPRTGSTLVEQILASHSRVEGTMELPELSIIARRLASKPTAGGSYLERIMKLDRDELREQGAAYLHMTRGRRKAGRAFFVDKMPDNWRHIGLIHLILPNAKIIDVRRHPMACGWSCFKQHFPPSLAYTYDLRQLGRYYAADVRLMAHYDSVLPGRVHRVIYEDLITDTEAHVRALLSYCSLPFEQGCLAPHRAERVVASASSEQVRQPISAKGLDDWRAYEPFLGELKAALGPALEAYPDAPV